MQDKIKIRISEQAYSYLMTILKNETEFSHLRFSYKDGCCGSSKAEILLDNLKENDVVDNIEELPILYDEQVLQNLKEITLVYRNNSLMVKAELLKDREKNCSSCSHGCGKNGNCAGGCSKHS